MKTNRVTTDQVAQAVISHDCIHEQFGTVMTVVDTALRTAIGFAGCAMGRELLVVDLGNGHELHCSVHKKEG